MKRYSRSLTATIACLAVIAWTTTTIGQDSPAELNLEQKLDELLPGMGADDISARRGPQSEWQNICFQLGVPSNEPKLREACALMAVRIGPATPLEARLWLLKQLERHGNAACVEALSAQLGDPEVRVRDAARRALTNNPAVEAGERLRNALAGTSKASDKIALVNALAYRAALQSTRILAKQLAAGDEAVAIAAVQALGKIGTPVAARELSLALEDSEGELRLNIADALARCGESLAEAGQEDEAAQIFALLAKGESPLNRAGLRGLLDLSGQRTAATVLSALKNDDRQLQDIALKYVGDLDSENIAQLADRISTLPPDRQIRLLAVLGARRDAAALPGVLKLILVSDNQALKIAAIEALGGVGDASAVPHLIEVLPAGGDIGDAARHALEETFADGVDQKLAAAMQATEDMGRRAMLIEMLDRRRAAMAVPALLEQLACNDGNVRSGALAALGRLASADGVPEMIAATLADSGLSDSAQRAITEVCRRVPDEADQADPVLKVYASAEDDMKDTLLPLLGRIGGGKALEAVRKALASNDDSHVEAGILALTNWPTAEVASDLADLAERLDNEAQKIRAIRGLARVVVLDRLHSDADELAFLKRAMKQATRDDERRLILDRAREARSIDTANFAAEYLDANGPVAEQACKTIVDLLHRAEIRGPNAEASDRILRRVIATTKNKKLAEDAGSYLSAQ